jgi:peptidyl-dipeptidase Dcp
MMRAWRAVHAHTLEEIETLATLAEADGIAGEMQPWDREYYREKRRQQEFDIEMDDVEAYFEFENMVEAMFWSAGRVYDLAFEQVDGLPTVAPEVRVYEVRREGDLLGVLWVDLFRRDGKAGGSFASQYRSYEDYRGEELVPLVALHSAAAPPEDGQPTLLPWERVNVIFHEFGHTLQTLSNTAPYPSLGPYALPWDFIEVPSLLHERWFRDRELLKRFALHYETGEAMPDSMLDRLEKALKYDRVFSVTLEFLAIAIVDMRLHMLADGREIDARAEERKILEEIGLPPSVAPMMPINNAVHPFTPVYAAGVYTYLWSDMLAADIATTFLGAPGGLYDEGVAARWRSEVLDIAFLLPPEAAFRNFRGRDPDIDALLRRFDLLD